MRSDEEWLINFLPWRQELQHHYWKVSMVWVLPVLIVAVLIVVGGYIRLSQAIQGERIRFQKLYEAYRQQEEVQKRLYDHARKQEQGSHSMQRLEQQWLRDMQATAYIVAALSQKIDRTICLVSIKRLSKTISLQGRASSMREMVQLLKTWTHSHEFTEWRLETWHAKPPIVHFTLCAKEGL